ncbi:GNAT family N-acetyltransferase [Streptomyces sp. NPDC017979]|uniref:GNAT family N-acetyltransferase n=1 Tax=Streptomyces sp. NPDC017979 TaxID=3365024 RepID=UPI0037B77DBB
MEPITLTTERLLLRSFTEDDTDEVYRLCQDADIQRWTTIPSPYERQHAIDFVGQMVPEGWRTGTMFTFAVVPAGGGSIMASVAVTLRTLSGTWEVGFWLGEQYRGRGIMTEAVDALARWSFSRLAATRLEWRAEVGNAASRAVAVRAGFTVEGELRASLLNNGSLRDVWVGSLLPSDLGMQSAYAYLPAAPARR